MPRSHSYLDVLARVLALPLSEGHASSDERFHAASAGADALIVDVEQRRYHRVPDARPLRFEDTVHDGGAQASLQLEQSDGVRTIELPAQDDSFWTPLPDPRVTGLPRIVQRHDTAWISPAPPEAEHSPQSRVVQWLSSLVSTAVLAFFAAFGFNALRWSLEGGWNLLWLLVGLPVFPIFGVLTLVAVYTLVRRAVPPPRRRALEAIHISRDESFRLGEPMAFRVDAVVPASVDGQPTQAPPQIIADLIVQTLNDPVDGDWSLKDQFWGAGRADVVPSTLTGTGERRVHYVGSVTATRRTPREAQERWYLALSTSREMGVEPFHIANVATPPLIVPYQMVQPPGRHAQFEALLRNTASDLIHKAYNGEDSTALRDDFTPEECRAVFTIDADALVNQAMATRWYEGRIRTGQASSGDSYYLLKEGLIYQLMYTEGHDAVTVYESPDLRSVVGRYLVAEHLFVDHLPGAETMKVLRPRFY
ncbi:hypothetical protein CLU95_1490 [Variovorax sp. 54]|uniref:hypothetical protein n=1 Tax=Variovorax sp. 54 TaxID=2035212 RepID=UPI000C17DD0A|nr:hypothetical protein [Variovorax sp. 54]PIF74363.1 hypothetical protein CLU95_1490 [Variovorax sp. 54]